MGWVPGIRLLSRAFALCARRAEKRLLHADFSTRAAREIIPGMTDECQVTNGVGDKREIGRHFTSGDTLLNFLRPALREHSTHLGTLNRPPWQLRFVSL